MNKTTIKISVLAFLGFMTYGYAQQQQQDPYKGKVGINTVTPSATMDVQPNSDNARVEAKTNEGIIAPKLSKVRIANIATPVEGTLVYATDDATSLISAYTGGDTKVAKITEKGYYFYNGTEWVKAGSDATDQLWAQRDNDGVTETYLKPADANSDFVGYRSDRKFRFNLGNLQENDFNYQSTDPNTSKGLAMLEVPFLTAISSDVLPEESTVGKKNKFFFSSNNALLKEKHVSKNPIGRYYGREDRIVIKDVDSKADTVYGTSGVVDLHSNNQLVGMIGVQGLSIAGTENGAYSNAMVKTIKGGAFKTSNFVNTERMEGISVAVRNYKKADNLIGGFFSTISQSTHNNQIATHTIENLQGIRNEVRLAPNGTVNKLFAGIYSNQFIASNTSFGIENELRGIFSHTDIASNANVDTNYVNIISTNTLHNNSYVKTLMDFGTYPRVQAGARVDRYIGVNISSGEIDAAPEINEMMGIRITNINKGKTKNYAIHTAAGNIRFGDLRHSVNTNVASTGDRPVFVTADGVLKVGNASTALSRAAWVPDTASNSVQLAITSANGDRTTHPISITDEGMVRATSFQGVNGATIFPDYVFQKYYTGTSSIKADYNFKSLSQVEDFVKTNGHLPGYKSAATIKAQGYVDLMETQLTNVEKIEELYLHSIEQDKALKAKESKIQELEAKNAALESRLERLEKLIQ